MPQTPAGTSTGGILAVIDFPRDIGFAIRHCVGAFYDMALDVTGDPQAVHFCFQSLTTPSTAFPDGFDNLLAFDRLHYTPESADRLNVYVAAHDIRTDFWFDLRFKAPFLATRRVRRGRPTCAYGGATRIRPRCLRIAL